MRLLKAAGCLTPVAILVYGAVGILLLAQYGGDVLNYAGSTGWTQVPGTVVSSTVEDAWDTTGDRYAARVVYTYEVDGEQYQGNRLNLRGAIFTGNREDAADLVAPYPAGASVMPYVNPADPTQSVLTREMPGSVLGIAGTGLALLLLSLLLGVRHFVVARKTQD